MFKRRKWFFVGSWSYCDDFTLLRTCLTWFCGKSLFVFLFWFLLLLFLFFYVVKCTCFTLMKGRCTNKLFVDRDSVRSIFFPLAFRISPFFFCLSTKLLINTIVLLLLSTLIFYLSSHCAQVRHCKCKWLPAIASVGMFSQCVFCVVWVYVFFVLIVVHFVLTTLYSIINGINYIVIESIPKYKFVHTNFAALVANREENTLNNIFLMQISAKYEIWIIWK